MSEKFGCRRQRDPGRDAKLTASFHRMLSRLVAPPKPVDGVPIPKALLYGDWPQWSGWSRVRVDVRFLK